MGVQLERAAFRVSQIDAAAVNSLQMARNLQQTSQREVQLVARTERYTDITLGLQHLFVAFALGDVLGNAQHAIDCKSMLRSGRQPSRSRR